MTFARTFRKGDRVSRIDARSARGTFVRDNLDRETSIVDWDGWGHTATLTEFLRHAPVVVVGQVPPKPPDACPWCGAETYLDNDVETFEPGDEKRRTVLAVVCSRCEFIEEVKK